MIAALLVLAQAAAPTPSRPAPIAVPAPAPVLPAPATLEKGDARCLAAFGMLAANQNPEVQRASQLGALYFYGKLLGRNPVVNLQAAMLEASGVIAPNVRGELGRCGGELQRSGQAMQAVGSAISRTAPAAAPTPRPAPTPAPTSAPTSAPRR